MSNNPFDYDMNPKTAMDVVENMNHIAYDRQQQAQANQPSAPAVYSGPMTLGGNVVGLGMTFAMLASVWGLLSSRDHSIVSALIAGAGGFAAGAALGVGLYLLVKAFAGIGELFRRVAFLRWTVIGGVLGAVAAVVLVVWLKDTGDIDRALIRLVPVGAVLGFLFGLAKLIFRKKPRVAG